MGDPRTLPGALVAAARADAGFCFVSGAADVRRTYAQLLDESFRAARSLVEAGLRRGDLVAVVLPDAEPFLTTLVGASTAGLVPASIYPPATTTELQRYFEQTAAILRAAAARAVVTTAALAPHFEALKIDCPDLALVLVRDRLDAPPLAPDTMPRLDDIAFVQFTSGSTSSPKGVAITHANLCANIDAINGPSGLATTDEDVAVSWLPLNHDMGLVGMALGAVYAARPCVLMPPQAFVKRPAAWLQAITRYRGTISFAPNFAYDLCVRRVKDVDGLDLSSWRVAGCGAEPIHAPTLSAFAEKFAPAGFRASRLLPSYGLAEHVLAATFSPPGRPPRTEEVSAEDLVDHQRAVPARGGDRSVTLVSCGRAFPGHEVRIVDSDGRPVPDRHVGEIALAGPSVMLGYYRQESATAEAIRGGWLRTGDLGYLSDGELFVCGRAKDTIIVNGRKYYPQDLEWAIDGVGGVRRGRIVAFAVSDPGRADRVIVVVEPNGTATAVALTEAIRRRVGEEFGLFVDDVAVVPSGTVGRTTSGKVQRAATRARYERGEFQTSDVRLQTSGPL